MDQNILRVNVVHIEYFTPFQAFIFILRE